MSYACESVVRNRMVLYSKILNSDVVGRDSLLLNVNSIKNCYINTNTMGVNSLMKDLFLDRLCDAIKTHNSSVKKGGDKNSPHIDLLIAGSTALAAVYNKTKIVPADVDMYIKNCNAEKLKVMDDLIQSFFLAHRYKILLIRNPVTITWIVYDENYDIIRQIQVSVLYMDSWAEIMCTYHSDITCIGFDVTRGEFLYLSGRWENVVKENKIHYFTNVVNLDTISSLTKACRKYTERGFNCRVISISDITNPGENDDLEARPLEQQHRVNPVEVAYNDYRTPRARRYMSDDHSAHLPEYPDGSKTITMDGVTVNDKTNNLLFVLFHKYYRISNIFYSNNIRDLYNDSQPILHTLKMAELEPECLNIPSSIELECACFPVRKAVVEPVVEPVVEKPPTEEKKDEKVEDVKTSNNPWFKDLSKVKSVAAQKPKLLPIKNNNMINFHECKCVCPVDQDSHRVFIKSKNCSHQVSLKSFIFRPISNCPLCRTPIDPFVSNIN